MRLISLRFQGFKSRERYAEVMFSKEPISVIFGPNGSGKTSFLKAITAFLSQDETSLSALGIEAIICEYEYDYVTNNGNQTGAYPQTTILRVNKAEEGYDWTEFLSSPLKDSQSLSLGVERGISTQSFRVEAEAIYDFVRRFPRYKDLFFREQPIAFNPREFAEELSLFIRRRYNYKRDALSGEEDYDKQHINLQNIKMENIENLLLRNYRAARVSANKKIQSALFNTLASAIIDDENNENEDLKSQTPEEFYKILSQNKERIIEALNDDSSNQFKSTVISILSSLDEENYSREIHRKPLLNKLFINIVRELQVEKLALSSMHLLIDTFNKYLIDDKRLIITELEIYIDVKNSKHSVNELSSGERHILTFLSLVLFQGQQRDFLIIDEPEISLNIVWQRQLLAVFRELVPETQIIVASHSPILSKKNTEYLTPLSISNIQQKLV